MQHQSNKGVSKVCVEQKSPEVVSGGFHSIDNDNKCENEYEMRDINGKKKEIKS